MSRSSLARLQADRLWSRAIAPREPLTVSAWAEKYRVLSPLEGPEPGPWRNARTPYLVEIMDALSSDSPTSVVVFVKGAQIGGTAADLNFMGSTIDNDPQPMLCVFPAREDVANFVRQKFDPMIEATPALRRKVARPKETSGGNTRMLKLFEGGIIIFAGANAARGLRQSSVGRLMLEEVDEFKKDVDGQGDPLLLAQRRTAAFPNAKTFINSTPTREHNSRIVRAAEGCESYWTFHVPCPACGTFQRLPQLADLDRFVYDLPARDPGDKGELHEIPNVRVRCVSCAHLIPESASGELLARGKWVALWNRGVRSRAFHLSSLYSPPGFLSWGRIAAMIENARGKPTEWKQVVNTVFGEVYAEEHDAPPWRALYDRREDYPIGEVPRGVIFLTAAVDVQGNRLECEVIGWGRDKISWSVAHVVFECEPGRTPDAAFLHRHLDPLLDADWPCVEGLGALPIRVLAIDSGFIPNPVYDWARPRPQPRLGAGGPRALEARTVAVVKGTDKFGTIVYRAQTVDAAADRRRGLRVWLVGANAAKIEFYRWARLPRPTERELAEGARWPHGFPHFPGYDEPYFQQLTSEKLVERTNRRGYRVDVFEKPPGVRNEALDLRVYNRAAASIFGLDRFQEPDWRRVEALLPPGFRDAAPLAYPLLGSAVPRRTVAPTPTAPPPSHPTTPRRRRAGRLPSSMR